MLRLLLVLCLFAMGSSLPVVISRYSDTRRRQRYLMEERRRINTCSLARMVNPDIKIGQCPNNTNEYKQLYTVSLLTNYYTRNCDVFIMKEKTSNASNYFTAFLAASFMLLSSFVLITCLVGFIMEIYSRIARYVAFLTTRPDLVPIN